MWSIPLLPGPYGWCPHGPEIRSSLCRRVRVDDAVAQLCAGLVVVDEYRARAGLEPVPDPGFREPPVVLPESEHRLAPADPVRDLGDLVRGDAGNPAAPHRSGGVEVEVQC